MAEAFLQIVLRNLNSLIQDEIGLIMGVDEEMKKLSSTFTTIQAVLEDAQEKQLESHAIRNWVCKLNDLVYEIDDILDECATHVSKMKLRGGKLSRYSVKKVLFQHNIGRRTKKVTESLDAVAAERAKFHLREMAVDKPREVVTERETGGLLNESHQIYGRDEDKEKLVDILVNGVKENKEITVLPIIGVGGLGKTTLAQLVFNEQQVVEHFEKKLWICVSDNFDVKTLIKAMIESATGSGSASDLVHLDTLQRRLWELLNRKRYLLVLDDVWNTDQEKWFLLKNILSCGSKGTSIIVTTRLKMVADLMGTLPAQCFSGLSEKHCWMLLRDRAFGEEKEEYPNLQVIGKQIVKKCAGVPMAAKALGGLLRFKRTEKEWNYVKESEIWNLESLILPALRLSYHHLPLALRQCFAYFAVFPKDFSIRKEELIRLWMAHGYISSRGILEVEDVGHEICNELVLRSLFQHHLFRTGEIIMHDLVHDLAQSIMDSKVPGVQVETQVTSASNSRIRQANLREKSVAFPTSIQHGLDITLILLKCSRLRVLDASESSNSRFRVSEASVRRIKVIPSTVGNLKHLRFLNLSFSKIRTLPNSLCSLWNLQTLNLNECKRLVALPKKTRSLNNLSHLFLENCYSLQEMPPKVGELTHLRTLSLFIVGLNRGNQLEELHRLNLGGRLEIRHLERVESYVDAKKADLLEKKDLRNLSLEWQRESTSRLEEEKGEKVLEALQPHPNLETLRIKGFSGRCSPIWMNVSTLEKIVRIDLKDCPNWLRLPKLGELPHLRFLRLENLAVEYIVEEGSPVNIQFPSLETLELISLPYLKGLPKFPSLQKLKIWKCSSLVLSSFPKLETLTSLAVEFGENMKCLPIEMMERLEEISLPEEGLRALKSLTDLWIGGSEAVTCWPQGWLRHLTALKQLTIHSCQELVELPEEIKYLNHLQQLSLIEVGKMVCLPKALQHLSSLKDLALHCLPQLNSLPDWLDDLTSLRIMYISECPKLVSLPRVMSNLRSLTIHGCPELERRCKRGTGEDWHKIAHIPNMDIGEENIKFQVGIS